MDYKKIKTYPEMNKTIKGLLAMSEDSIMLYALKRIEELEAEAEELKQTNKKLTFMVENGLGEDDMRNDITYPVD